MPGLELPEHVKTQQGRIRKVGFELEYAGVDLEKSSEILQGLISGTLDSKDTFSHTLKSEKFGEFVVEIDADLLKEGKYKDYLAALGIEVNGLSFENKLDEVIKDIASTVVPCEIVTPPLPMDNMQIVEDIVKVLRREKAKGASESVLYAFGLHMNPELATDKPDYLLNHIKAFTVLYDWISAESEVDLTRRLTPYIKPYPAEYIELILADDYHPDIDNLIDDYMAIVGSRNHALDMLPAFAEIDEEKVMNEASEAHLVKPRPAFHYRLANCLIDREDWQVADEWQYWLRVEELAYDRKTLDKLSHDYLEYKPDSVLKSANEWVSHVSGIMG